MRNAFIYTYLLTCVFIFSQFLSYSQNKKIDSLVTVLSTQKRDTSRVKTLVILCKEFRTAGEMDKAFLYGNEGLKLAGELQWKKGQAELLTNIGIAHWSQGNYSQALNNYIEALKINEEIDDEDRIANSYSNIGLVYWNQGDYPKALKCYFKSLKINE